MTDDSQTPPLMRSALFVPGDKPRALEKAAGLNADAIILDLEDAVAPDNKAQARNNALSAIPVLKASGLYIVLRMAEPGALDLAADLAVAAQAQPDAVLIAKLETAEQLSTIRARLNDTGYHGPIWAMIETPRAILEVDAIARQAAFNGLQALVAGANDLSADLRLPAGPDRRARLEPHLARLVLAARAFGLVALDAVYNAYKDETGLLQDARHGRAMGFDGKTLIHPAQISATHTAFAPSEAEIEWARRVNATFEDPANTGKGAVPLDGEMIEHMHWRAARALLNTLPETKDA